jgi:hypothetical protein
MSNEWDTGLRISMSVILKKGTEFMKADEVSGCGSAEINSPRAWLLFKEYKN